MVEGWGGFFLLLLFYKEAGNLSSRIKGVDNRYVSKGLKGFVDPGQLERLVMRGLFKHLVNGCTDRDSSSRFRD